jgi:tetratricopeptide (TPR) repeat protein
MLRLDEHHGLLAAALFAVFSPAPQVLLAQAPAAGPASPAPASIPQPPAVAPAPLAPVTPEQLGDSLGFQQRYQAAIDAYNKIPRKSPAVWNKMGIDYQMLFDSEDATRCYKQSLKLDSRNALVINNLGTVYDSLKQYKTAERMYRKALKIDPRSAAILQNLGTNLLVQHKDAQGWEAYRQALAIDPLIFQNSNSPKVQNPGSLRERGVMNYFMARACAASKLTDCALQYLRMALDEGYTTPSKVAQDKDFANLFDDPAFKQLLTDESKH